jgi:hypothetical protein
MYDTLLVMVPGTLNSLRTVEIGYWLIAQFALTGGSKLVREWPDCTHCRSAGFGLSAFRLMAVSHKAIFRWILGN